MVPLRVGWGKLFGARMANAVTQLARILAPFTLSIYSEYGHQEVITRLLDLGASPKVRDSQGNTALHHLAVIPNIKSCDKRLFIYDEDTFEKESGMCHFHIACHFSPETLDIVYKHI